MKARTFILLASMVIALAYVAARLQHIHELLGDDAGTESDRVSSASEPAAEAATVDAGQLVPDGSTLAPTLGVAQDASTPGAIEADAEPEPQAPDAGAPAPDVPTISAARDAGA